jgi:hypothetical protein
MKIKRISEQERLKYLFEYKINKGVIDQNSNPTDEAESDEVFNEISSLISNEDNENEMEESSIDKVENETDVDVNKADNDSFEDTAIDLFKVHASKFEKLTNTINDVIESVNNLNATIENQAITTEQLQTSIESLDKRVEVLTPPTPLESLNKMINISGGQSIEDYWNEYLRKNGQQEINKTIYYNNPQYTKNEKGMTNDVYKTQNYTDNELNDIIKSI